MSEPLITRPVNTSPKIADGAKPQQRDLVKAALWMCCTLVSFALLAVSARQLLDSMMAFQILFLRSAIGLVIILAIGFVRFPDFYRTRRWRLHLLRNTFHYGGQACWITAIGILPLATVFALEFTTPIWAALLAAFFLGEKLNSGRLIAIALGFIGVLVILRPGLVPIDMGVIIALSAAIGFAVSLAATKGLTRSDQPITILFYMLTMQLLLGAPLALWTWAPVILEDLPWLIAVAITGLSAHYGITRAFQYADASLILPMDFLRLPLIALVGFLFYSEALEATVFLGALLMFAGNYHAIRKEAKASQA